MVGKNIGHSGFKISTIKNDRGNGRFLWGA